MKQVTQAIKDGKIQILDVPEPTLRPQGIVAHTAWSLISSGTERAKVVTGQMSLVGKARSRPDQVAQVVAKVRSDGLLQTYRTVKTRLEELNPIGYSCAGVVSAVGELAGGIKPGDLVSCGGAGHAEVVYVPSTLCVPVPPEVGLDEAAFATVGAVALQGVRQSGAVLGDRVAVIGLGLLGLLTVQLLRAAGCEVAGMDPDSARCELAEGFGARTVTHGAAEEAALTLLAATSGRGYDTVILTAATKDAGPIRLAGEISRDRGTVVVVGDVNIDVPRSPFYEKELTVRLSRSYGPGRYDPMYEELAIDYPPGYVPWTEQRNMAEIVRLLAEHRLDVRSLITHRFPVEQAAEAYSVLSTPGSGALGVLLQYEDQSETTWAEGAPGDRRIWLDKVAATCAAPDKVGVSFLGAGNFATATLLPALKTDERFIPRGVYTTSGLSARDVAARNQFAYCAGDPSEMLTDEGTDAIIIATRHASHAELTTQALRAGKVVFVEKPLAISEEELAGVVEAQRETGGRITVGFNRRFAPLTRNVVELLGSRSTPATVLIRVNAGAIPPEHWIQRLEEGGGRIVGEVCHFVDLANCLVGQRPKTVFAASADRAKAPALVDTLSITLTYPDNSLATVVYAATGDTKYPKERVEVFCEGSVMVVDDFRTLAVVQGGRTQVEKSRRIDKGHSAEMRAFLDMAQSGPSKILTFADCVASMTSTFKVIESLTTGQPVRLA